MNRAFPKILILVIIVVLVGGGIFAWQYFGAPENITNWKTYKNEGVGFEVRYPSDLKEEWKLSEESLALREDWGEQKGKRLLLFSMSDSNKVYGFGFSVYSNPNNLTLKEFSQKLMDWEKLGCQLKTTEDILFGGEQTSGVKFIFHNCNNARTPDEIISQVLIKKNDKVIEISGIGSLSDSKFVGRFNLILSTFKFIEGKTVKDETADWKTYRNEEYGFEIEYPQGWKVATNFPGRLGPGQTERREGINPKSFNFAPNSKDLTIAENGDIILYIAPSGFSCAGKTNVNLNNISDFLRQNSREREIEFCKLTAYFRFSLIGTQKEIFTQMLSTFRFLE